MSIRGPLLALLLCATLSASAAPTTQDHLPVRDGTRLATDVWLPDDDATHRWPVILRRTPYGRAFDEERAADYTRHGWAVVSQDVRGRGGSEGRFLPFFDDATDGADTIAWVAAQPWCDGTVVSIGASAEAAVQYMALGEGPAELDCASTALGTADLYAGMFPGGAWRTELTSAWLDALDAPDVEAAWRANEDGGAYWDPARLDDIELARVRVPVFAVAGFFDIFDQGGPATHRALVRGAAPEVRGDQFLLLGPWTHGRLTPETEGGPLVEGELRYDADAAFDGRDVIAFLDYCRGTGPRPAWPPVRYFRTRVDDDGRTASGSWRTADLWPPPAREVALYLHEAGTLAPSAPGSGGAPRALQVDPAAPLPSLGGGNLTTPAGPFDVAALDARPDVFVAETPVLDATVLLEGDVHATIWAASSGDDADVVVRFSQVTPAGRVLQMTDGIRRGRLRDGSGVLRPLLPGAPTRFDVALGPVALEVRAGHALRVAVQGASAPRYEPSSGQLVPLAETQPTAPWTLTVYHDTDHPSVVILPVAAGRLPGEATPPAADAGATDATEADAQTADIGSPPRDVVVPTPDAPRADDASGPELPVLDVILPAAAPTPPDRGGCAIGTRAPALVGPVVLALLLGGALRRRRTMVPVRARGPFEGRERWDADSTSSLGTRSVRGPGGVAGRNPLCDEGSP